MEKAGGRGGGERGRPVLAAGGVWSCPSAVSASRREPALPPAQPQTPSLAERAGAGACAARWASGGCLAPPGCPADGHQGSGFPGLPRLVKGPRGQQGGRSWVSRLCFHPPSSYRLPSPCLSLIPPALPDPSLSQARLSVWSGQCRRVAQEQLTPAARPLHLPRGFPLPGAWRRRRVRAGAGPAVPVPVVLVRAGGAQPGGGEGLEPEERN